MLVDTATDLFAIQSSDCKVCPDITSVEEIETEDAGSNESQEIVFSQVNYGKNTMYGSDVKGIICLD